MNIIERIIKIAENKGVSLNQFSKKIGVSNAYFSKQKKNNANVGSHIIEKIVRIYPDINIEWLITGEGDMIKSGESPGGASSADNRHLNMLEKQLQDKELHIKDLQKSIDLLQNQLKDCQKDKEHLYKQIEIILKTAGKEAGGTDV